MSFQLALQSNARKSFPPVTFQSIQISFSEQIPEMTIVHKSGNSQTVQKPSLGGTSDLSLQPGQLKVLEFSYVPSAQAQIEVLLHMRCLMRGHDCIPFSCNEWPCIYNRVSWLEIECGYRGALDYRKFQ